MINNNPLTTGADSFRELVSTDNLQVDPKKLFVDKTLFIKDFLDSSGKVLLITRPRRWGKTLALSMLQHFLSKEVEGFPTKDLFSNLKITQFLSEFKYQKYFGTNPVILVTFKDLEGETFDEIKESIEDIISDLYSDHEYILHALQDESPNFKFGKANFNKYQNAFIKIMDKKSNLAELKKSIKLLSELLNKYHHKKVFILIDEYDNAINGAMNNPELIVKLTKFFSGLFGSCLKGNRNLEKGLVTGVLRVAKANIFSGLNNLSEYTLLDSRFSEYYGFTEQEVSELLAKANISNQQDIKNWYNGYLMGGVTIYNPWSIMQCIENKGLLQTYWANSGNPYIVKNLLIEKLPVRAREEIGVLLKRGFISLPSPIQSQISLDQINNNPAIIWSLLLHTGYLTVAGTHPDLQLRIPNEEVKILIKEQIDVWVKENPRLGDIANALLVGNMVGFEETLREVLADPAYSARIFGGGGKAAKQLEVISLKEFVYHFLIMAELRCINTGNDSYEVIAEPEGVSLGRTRPDLLVINHDRKLCVVIELKIVVEKKTKLMTIAKERALQQIDDNHYGKSYKERGYSLLKVGIAFRGADFEIAYKFD